MTIDEAIQKHLGIATSYKDTVPDCDIAREHKQVVEWLTELKELRVKVKQMEKDYVELEEINSRHMWETDSLLDVVREDYRIITKLKRLLKSALDDFKEIRNYLGEPYARLCGKWRYADEAESLIRDIEDRTNDN